MKCLRKNKIERNGFHKDGIVSIIMLTHNAPEYVRLSLETLQKTDCDMPIEIIVVDNASELETQQLLLDLKGGGVYSKTDLSRKKPLFCKGK